MMAEKATELFRKKRQSLGEGTRFATWGAKLLVDAAAYGKPVAHMAVASAAAASVPVVSTSADRAFAPDGVQHCTL